MRAAAHEHDPGKRFGTPEEFGATCAFLCSAQASYITGQNVLIDGGAYPGTYTCGRSLRNGTRTQRAQRIRRGAEENLECCLCLCAFAYSAFGSAVVPSAPRRHHDARHDQDEGERVEQVRRLARGRPPTARRRTAA
jgi:hypothetical protein